jgi:prepilin-type processing-associated H-X9-DG protein
MDNGQRIPETQTGLDENLLGYALKTLDADAHREVEFLLATRPELRQRLELFRHSLEPLESDREGPDPPPGLAIRALARVAEYCCRELPRAPTISAARTPAPGRHWWRRADVLVAATLLLTVGILVPPVLNYVQQRHQIEACKNNLMEFGKGLLLYGDNHHGEFPAVHQQKSNYAGIVVPVLVQAGTLPSNVSLSCPGNGACQPHPWSKAALDARGNGTLDFPPEQLENCYAYSLGYLEAGPGQGVFRGLRRSDGCVPIMSDKPANNVYDRFSNSPNHDGRGQNVLFTDGHVEFFPQRIYQNDDFFLNQSGKVAAGVSARDFVLGDYKARPDGEEGAN